MKPKTTISPDWPQELALNFVRFLAQDEERLSRFLALTGMDPTSLRDQLVAQDHEFLGNVLDYALQDESLLLQFATEAEIDPNSLLVARSRLPGFSQ